MPGLAPLPRPFFPADDRQSRAARRRLSPFPRITPTGRNARSHGSGRGHEGDQVTSRARREPLAESTLRVDVTLLNRMMNLVGELVAYTQSGSAEPPSAAG